MTYHRFNAIRTATATTEQPPPAVPVDTLGNTNPFTPYDYTAGHLSEITHPPEAGNKAEAYFNCDDALRCPKQPPTAEPWVTGHGYLLPITSVQRLRLPSGKTLHRLSMPKAPQDWLNPPAGWKQLFRIPPLRLTITKHLLHPQSDGLTSLECRLIDARNTMMYIRSLWRYAGQTNNNPWLCRQLDDQHVRLDSVFAGTLQGLGVHCLITLHPIGWDHAACEALQPANANPSITPWIQT